MVDISILGSALHQHSTQQSRRNALEYFETLRKNSEGWKSLVETFDEKIFFGIEPELQFACVVVLQYHVKEHHNGGSVQAKNEFRNFTLTLTRSLAANAQKVAQFIKLKVASFVASLVFIDYPQEWPSFFHDLAELYSLGNGGIEMFLEVLYAVNSDISDRELYRTEEEFTRSTHIKDSMRDDCIPKLALLWKSILADESVPETLWARCMNVIAGYIQWIDISEVANDEMVALLLRYCGSVYTRKAAVEAIEAVCCKGMLPDAKLKLLQSFYTVLEQEGLFQFQRYDDGIDDNIEFLCTIASYVNSSLLQLVDIFKDTFRKDFSMANGSLEFIESKIDYIVALLTNEDDDVSKCVLAISRELILIYKIIPVTSERKEISKRLLSGIVLKYKYDSDHSFGASQDDEDDFLVYRQELRVVFDNLAKLDNFVVTEFVRDRFMAIIPDWKNQPFDTVELTISLLFLLGESLPHVSGNVLATQTPCTEMVCQMLAQLLESEVSLFDHPAVILVYHEVIVRYDKFFAAASNNHYIPRVLDSFTDSRGILSKYPSVRGRSSYLFCRFVKMLKTSMTNYRDSLLSRIEKVLEVVFSGGSPAVPVPSNEDCQYLFEIIGILVHMCSPEVAPVMMDGILQTINSNIHASIAQLNSCHDKDQQIAIANKFADFVSYASRISKAFNSHQQVEALGCLGCLMKTLDVILQAMSLRELCHDATCIVHTAVRQYMHRMAICSGEKILPYVPTVVNCLLQDDYASLTGLVEFMPLVNQIIAKCKAQSVPMLQLIFMHILQVFSRAVSCGDASQGQGEYNQEENDKLELRTSMKRAFFTFINTILANDAYQVISCQGSEVVWMVLMSVVDGAITFPDPVTQKLCFSILRRFIEVADGNGEIERFTFQHVIPACFSMCCNAKFNPKDAQSNMTLLEAGGALKFCHEKYGAKVVEYLCGSYLPSQNLPPDLSQDLCTALQSLDSKRFREYFKDWLLKLIS